MTVKNCPSCVSGVMCPYPGCKDKEKVDVIGNNDVHFDLIELVQSVFYSFLLYHSLAAMV